MKKWIGSALAFFGFLGVVPIAWGVTATIWRNISPGSAVSSGEKILMAALVAGAVFLAGHTLHRVARSR